MSLPTSASKPQWRQWAQGVRGELPVTDLSAQLVRHLRAWQPYREARHVLSYMAFGSELDLGALPEDEGKTFYVTRTWKKPELRLSVHRLDGGLERHPYGYYQPPADAEPIDPKTLDLILVPGLCFDRAGGRVGYGAGYYDRFLPKVRAGVPRVGVTAEALVVPELYREDHDVPVTHLVTEKGVVSVGRSQ